MREPVQSLQYVNDKRSRDSEILRSLISNLISRLLDSVIFYLYMFRFKTHANHVTDQGSLRLSWSKTQNTGFLVTGLIRGYT